MGEANGGELARYTTCVQYDGNEMGLRDLSMLPRGSTRIAQSFLPVITCYHITAPRLSGGTACMTRAHPGLVVHTMHIKAQR